MTDEQMPAAETIQATTKLIGKELLVAMLDECKANTQPWHKMNESQQQEVIERCKTRVRTLVVNALRVLSTGAVAACPATLTSLRVGGDSSKGGISIPKNAPNRHELMDRVGQSIVVLMIDPEQHLKGMEDVKAKSQQGGLFDDPETPYIPDDDRPEDEASAETEALEQASKPAEPEDDTKWVQTGNNPAVERHVTTGEERRSTEALQADLVNKLCDINQNPKLDSVDFTQEEIEAAPRGQVLLALLWADTYAKGKHEDTAARPDFLRRST